MSPFLKTAGCGCAVLLLVVFVGLTWLGSQGPDIAVYPGRQVPKAFMQTIRDLGLLEEDETLRFFYSDALFEIEEGLYFVTDRHLVLYSRDWEEPRTIVPLEAIDSLSVDYDESFWQDSMVSVSAPGVEVVFPVSSEGGLDRSFVQAIEDGLRREVLSPDGLLPDPESGGDVDPWDR